MAGDVTGRALQIDPPAFLDDPALQAVLLVLPACRVVGGAVRDTLAGLSVADVDLATPDPPDAVVRALEAAGLKHAPTGLQHGTVTAISGGRGFEVTTLRTDERTDGRHAEVAWTQDWRQDAARRDFTINALSMDRDGAVFDYFGGVGDLRAGRVRFVGDAAARLAEDYLRLLRFFRFHARYAADPPDEATARALQDAVAGLPRLSVERVWSELKRILSIPGVAPTVDLMASLGVLDAVLPGADRRGLGRLVAAGAPPDPLLRLAGMLPSTAGLAERLKLSGGDAAVLAGLTGPPPDPEWDDDALRRALAETPGVALIGRSWLAGDGTARWAALRARLEAMQRPVFPLHGRDVVRLGVAAGPRVGELLAEVRAWWMAGGCVAGAGQCRAELADLAAR